jgi:hypothetical protein
MPSPATDRQPLYLGAAAVAFAALAVFSVRMVDSASAVSEAPIPTIDVAGVTSDLRPSSDTGRLETPLPGAMVVRRDPLAGRVAPPSRETKSINSSSSSSVTAPVPAAKPMAVDATQWVVSSILFEATRRSAIVNNAWVTVGDPVGGGARLSGIERKHVVVTDPNGIQHIVPIRRGEK